VGSIPDEVNFLIYLIIPAALGPGVYSASNRNEYQELKIIMFLGSKVRRVRKADNLGADCLDNVGSLTSHNPIGLQGLLRGQLYFFFFTVHARDTKMR
jgi:hypothetical protein